MYDVDVIIQPLWFFLDYLLNFESLFSLVFGFAKTCKFNLSSVPI